MHAQLLEEVRKLPVKEQVELVDEILEGLPSDMDSGRNANLSPEQIAELEKRMAGHLTDPDSAIPWSEVQRDIEARFDWKL